MIGNTPAPHKHDGCTWWVVAPATALDVLEVEAWHMSRLIPDAESGQVSVADLRGLRAWCAQHIVDVDGLDCGSWESLSVGARREALDRYFGVDSLRKLKDAIIDRASLPVLVVHQMRQWWYVQHSGGCECPVCEERKPSTPENLRRWCRFGELDGRTIRILNNYPGAVDSDLLHAPYWLYQCKTAHQQGKSRAIKEEMDKRDDRKTTDNVLKQRGYLK